MKKIIFISIVVLIVLIDWSGCPESPPITTLQTQKWHPGGLKAPDGEKFLYTDDDRVVDNIIASGYSPRSSETVVQEVEDHTPFRITVQDYYNTGVCVQRVRIYTEQRSTQTSCPEWIEGCLKTVQEGEERIWKLRDSLLANCEGGTYFIPRSRYRFSFTNAIHVYSANRIIFKIYWGKELWKCHDRRYVNSTREDKDLTQYQCEERINRIYTLLKRKKQKS